MLPIPWVLCSVRRNQTKSCICVLYIHLSSLAFRSGWSCLEFLGRTSVGKKTVCSLSIKDVQSESNELVSGAPQGSMLGHIKFGI